MWNMRPIIGSVFLLVCIATIWSRRPDFPPELAMAMVVVVMVIGCGWSLYRVFRK